MRVGVAGTEVAAMTIHALLDLNPDMESKLDFTKGNPKTAVLMSLDVLFIDEVSMIDVDCWQAVAQAFSVIDHTKRPHDRSGDAFGELHVLLFGDFKQDRTLFRMAHTCRTQLGVTGNWQ